MKNKLFQYFSLIAANPASKLSKKQKIVKDKLDNILSSIPNVPLKDVPIGKDENDNKEVVKVEISINFLLNPSLIMK